MKRPSGDWGSTGGGRPDLAGALTLPPGTNGTERARKLLCQIISALYSCVGSAQNAPRVQDEQEHAVHQMVIANAALAAGEGDAFLTLLSAGLEGSSCIHLRALGELAARVVLCKKHPDLALKLYRSWAPSWERLIKMQRPDVQFDSEMEESAKSMRDLERSEEFKTARDAIISDLHLLNPTESTMWSKRSHGDIYALVQVSVNLAQRGEDVRTPIVTEVPYGIMVEVLLVRAIGFALLALTYIVSVFKIAVPKEVLEGFGVEYKAVQGAMPRLPPPP